MESQLEKAEKFRKFHDRREVLVLPNAWDVPSARLFGSLIEGAITYDELNAHAEPKRTS